MPFFAFCLGVLLGLPVELAGVPDDADVEVDAIAGECFWFLWLPKSWWQWAREESVESVYKVCRGASS